MNNDTSFFIILVIIKTRLAVQRLIKNIHKKIYASRFASLNIANHSLYMSL